MTGSQQLLFSFCNLTLLESKPVAQRAVNIWQNVKKIVFIGKICQKPDGKCYNTVVSSVNNKFVILKLHFYLFCKYCTALFN